MTSEKDSNVIRLPSRHLGAQNSTSFHGTRMLTASEIEQLKQNSNETDELAKKAFAHLRPSPEANGD